MVWWLWMWTVDHRLVCSIPSLAGGESPWASDLIPCQSKAGGALSLPTSSPNILDVGVHDWRGWYGVYVYLKHLMKPRSMSPNHNCSWGMARFSRCFLPDQPWLSRTAIKHVPSMTIPTVCVVGAILSNVAYDKIWFEGDLAVIFDKSTIIAPLPGFKPCQRCRLSNDPSLKLSRKEENKKKN